MVWGVFSYCDLIGIYETEELADAVSDTLGNGRVREIEMNITKESW